MLQALHKTIKRMPIFPRISDGTTIQLQPESEVNPGLFAKIFPVETTGAANVVKREGLREVS